MTRAASIKETTAIAGPLLLDTHAWIWWAAGAPELPPDLRQRIDEARAGGLLWVSSISVWEVALLVERGRLTLTYPVREWVARNEAVTGLRFLPVDNALALRSVELQNLHRDPADRLIVASAERLRAALVTRDERLQDLETVTSIWS